MKWKLYSWICWMLPLLLLLLFNSFSVHGNVFFFNRLYRVWATTTTITYIPISAQFCLAISSNRFPINMLFIDSFKLNSKNNSFLFLYFFYSFETFFLFAIIRIGFIVLYLIMIVTRYFNITARICNLYVNFFLQKRIKREKLFNE